MQFIQQKLNKIVEEKLITREHSKCLFIRQMIRPTLPQNETVTDQSGIVQQEESGMAQFQSVDCPFLIPQSILAAKFSFRLLSFWQQKHLPNTNYYENATAHTHFWT
jgi:hypothetical protein